MEKRKELLLALATLAVASTATLAIAEIAIRVIASQRHIYNIEMVKYATKLKMPDPAGLVSHVHQPNKKAELMGVEISLNNLGNRGPELATPKPPGTKRVFVLGSSVTMGWGVPYEQVFTTVAETHLNSAKPFGPLKFEFANAGIGNYNTFAQYKLFQKQYPELKPDFVVLHYFFSDVEPRTMGRNSQILRHSFLAAWLFDRVKSVLMLHDEHVDIFKYYGELYKDDSAAWKQTQSYIAEMKAKTQADHVPFLIMIIPDFHNLALNSPYKAVYENIENKFRALGIATINTFPEFQKLYGSRESELWIDESDPHPNGKAHIVMADMLYDYLTRVNPLNLSAPR